VGGRQPHASRLTVATSSVDPGRDLEVEDVPRALPGPESDGREMSKKTESARFTKIATDLMLDVKSLVNWGLDTGNTTEDDLRALVLQRNPVLRREAAIRLIESGVSQRKAAKILGVDHKTIQNDLANKSPKSGEKVATAVKAKRAKIAAGSAAKGIAAITPGEKYRIIYADPPWDYGSHAQAPGQTSSADHYAVMDIEAICAEPIKDHVEDDAVLFLWVTSPFLEKALPVVRAWGFEYKASFVWDKIKHNVGHYNSVRHELLLICTRGSCLPDTKELIDSVQNIERGEHSEKPVEFFDIIETLYTRGRRLQMYGRKHRPGWDTHGHLAELEAAE
jgi:N6-adenosine-specific RNA methylase IME4